MVPPVACADLGDLRTPATASDARSCRTAVCPVADSSGKHRQVGKSRMSRPIAASLSRNRWLCSKADQSAGRYRDRRGAGDRHLPDRPLLLLDDLATEADALVADVDARPSDQLACLALRLPTERAAQRAIDPLRGWRSPEHEPSVFPFEANSHAAHRLALFPGGDCHLAGSLVCGRGEVPAAATAAATTAGTKSIPTDRTPASAASARQAAPKINTGRGHRRVAATATDPVPAASSARYHHAGELPCPVMTAT